MGPPLQLITALLCLLACTSNFTHGHITLEEIIRTLNILTERQAKDHCMELTVADVFAAPKNTTEKETLCRAAAALRQIYQQHKCKSSRLLRQVDRNLYGLAHLTHCPENETKKSTLKKFLERLKRTMQEKYSKG